MAEISYEDWMSGVRAPQAEASRGAAMPKGLSLEEQRQDQLIRTQYKPDPESPANPEELEGGPLRPIAGSRKPSSEPSPNEVSFEDWMGGKRAPAIAGAGRGQADSEPNRQGKRTLSEVVEDPKHTLGDVAGAVGRQAADVGKDAVGTIAAASDFLLGLPGMIANTAIQDISAIGLAAAHDFGLEGKSNKDYTTTLQTASEWASKVAPSFDMIEKGAGAIGADPSESVGGKAVAGFNAALDAAGDKYAEMTGRPKEEGMLLINNAMAAGAGKGGRASMESVAKTFAERAKAPPKDAGVSAGREEGDKPQPSRNPQPGAPHPDIPKEQFDWGMKKEREAGGLAQEGKGDEAIEARGQAVESAKAPHERSDPIGSMQEEARREAALEEGLAAKSRATLDVESKAKMSPSEAAAAKESAEARDTVSTARSPSYWKAVEIMRKPAWERTPEDIDHLERVYRQAAVGGAAVAVAAAAYGLNPDDHKGLATVAALAAIPLAKKADISLKDGARATIEHARQETYDALVAKDASGKLIGYLKMSESPTGMVPEVWVREEARNNHVATRLYDQAKEMGYKIRDDTFRTQEGKGFREKYDNAKDLDFSGGKQKGSVDPAVLRTIALSAAGAAAGAYLWNDKHPILGGIVGMGGALLVGHGINSAISHLKGGPLEAQAARTISDILFKAGKQTNERLLTLRAYLAEKMPSDYAAHAKAIFDSYDKPGTPLGERAQWIKDNVVEPIRQGNSAIRDTLRALGVEVGRDIPENYIHRMRVKTPSAVKDFFDKLSADPSMGRNLSRSADSLKEREVIAMKTSTGDREVLVRKEGGRGRYAIMRNGRKAGEVTLDKDGKGKWQDRDYSRDEAAVHEVEKHTSIRYTHDAMAAEIENNMQLSRALNNAVALDQITKLPSFEDIATKGEAPEGWRSTGIDQLRQYKFAPRVSYVLDDFEGLQGRSATETIGKVSRVLTGSMFWDPLPHIWNVLDHAIVQRGVSGLSPHTYPRLIRTTLQAAKAVMTQNHDFLRYLHEGAGLMYDNVLLEGFSDQVLKHLGTQPQMGAVAKAFGYANPAALIKGVYGASRKALWAANDIIMMQAYLEKEGGGMKMPDVIREVERHIPNYRVAEKIAGSRFASQYMQSPFLSAFGRYDYGRLHSYGEMIRDAIGRDKSIKDRARALDQMAMVGVMGLVVYPMLLDNIARMLTGNPNAEANRFGASTIPHLLWSYFNHDKDLPDIARSIIPQGPAAVFVEEMFSGRDLFTGKKTGFQDIPEWVTKNISPLYSAARISGGKMTPEQFLWQALGIKDPSAAQVSKADERKQKRMGGSP